ncbi:MAG: TldD/PmbA family protein [Clostridiales bacterium]|nr:TldD/PmbA family protein [Clostridiales bacterium]
MDTRIRSFIDTLLKRAVEEGFVESEVYFESDASTAVQALEGKIIQFESSDASGLSFRGLYNGQMGYAYTEDISDDMIPFLLSQAKDNCKVLEVKEKITVYEGDKEYPEFNGFNEELAKIGYQEMADAALALEKETLAYDKRIESVDDCFVAYSSGTLLIINSKGMVCESQDNSLDVYVGCRAKEGEDVQTAGKSWSFSSLGDLNISKCAETVGKKVIGKLGAHSIPSEKTSVILDRFAARSLLGAFAGAFSAEAMQKGLSRLAGRVGEKIANDNITLIDEGMIDKSQFCIPFDSEGVSAKRTVLIDKGVFTSALHNRKTALVEGKESTGNGFRGGAKGSLGISNTNFHFENGSLSFDDLLKKMNNGILITALHGLHAGVNAISGDFSLMTEGFLVKDGKITEPVNQITIADNFFDVLLKIEELADDVDYFAFDGAHIQSPSLLIPNVSIAGE